MDTKEWIDDGNGVNIPTSYTDPLRFGFNVPGVLRGWCKGYKKRLRGSMHLVHAIIDTSSPRQQRRTFREWLEISHAPVVIYPLIKDQEEHSIGPNHRSKVLSVKKPIFTPGFKR